MKAFSVNIDLTFWGLQSLYSAVQKNKMRRVDCVLHRRIWTSLASKYAFEIRSRALKPHAVWQGSSPGWLGTGVIAALCPDFLAAKLAACTFGVALHALQPMCALSTFSRLFSCCMHLHLFPPSQVFEAFLPLSGGSSPHFSFSSCHSFSEEEQLEEKPIFHHQNFTSLSALLCARHPC